MNRKFLFLIIGITFTSFTSFGQKKWGLQECIDTAVINNLNLLQASNNTEINQNYYLQSKNNYLPSFEGSASEAYNNKFFGTGNNRWSTNVSVSGNLVLFDGFQKYYAVKQSEANYKASTFELEDYKNQLIINVLVSYLQILYSNEAIKIAENQVSASIEQVKKTQAFVDAGKQAEYNLILIKSQLATDKLNLVSAKNQLKTSVLTLQQLMEIPANEDFEIVYYYELPVPEVEPEVVNDIYNTSLNIMPIIKEFEQTVYSAEFNLKSLQNYRLPRLSLNGNLGTNYSGIPGGTVYSDPFGTQFKNNSGSNISLTLSVPIFSKFQNRTNIKVQEIKLENVKLSQKSQNNSLRKEIEQAYNDLTNSSAKYHALGEQLNAVKISYENSKTRYDNGLMSATDLLLEKNKLIKAESDILQSKYDLIFKSKVLDYYKGNPISIQ